MTMPDQAPQKKVPTTELKLRNRIAWNKWGRYYGQLDDQKKRTAFHNEVRQNTEKLMASAQKLHAQVDAQGDKELFNFAKKYNWQNDREFQLALIMLKDYQAELSKQREQARQELLSELKRLVDNREEAIGASWYVWSSHLAHFINAKRKKGDQ